MFILVANIHMRDPGTPDLNQDLPTFSRKYLENRVYSLYENSTFFVQYFALVRMICSEDGGIFQCAHCTKFSGASAL
jgi:hypothetical protein